MSHPASRLAIVACLAFAGSVAHATPRKAKVVKQKAKPAPVVEEDDDDEEEEAPKPRKHRAPKHVEAEDEDDAQEAPKRKQAAFVDPDAELEVDEVTPVTHAPRRRAAQAWHVAIGPYLWASDVDASVSVGGTDVGKGIDFNSISKNAKFGLEMLGEVRFGRFALTGDLTYGVVGITGGEQVGPLMVTLGGEASSLLVDSALGYMLYGDDTTKLAIEARGGVRYQKTTVDIAVGVEGASLAPPRTNLMSRDALVGARVFVRPFGDRLFFTGTGDVGVFGTSTSTWSLSADASLRMLGHVMLSVGYRTLTMDGAEMSTVMHGPRVAVQVTF